MGQRQNKDEIEYGDDCLVVWDPGKTPKYIYMRFSKIEKCPGIELAPPNDRVFKLTQVEDAACAYLFNDGTWQIVSDLNAIPKPTIFNLMSLDPYKLYFKGTSENVIEEGQVFENEYPGCDTDFGGTGGIAVVTWKLESLKVMGLLNMKTQNDLFMEMRPKDNGSRVYKYCKLSQSTNIKILYAPG